MSISVPLYLIKKAENADTHRLHKHAMFYSDDKREITLETQDMSDEAISEMIELCQRDESIKSSVERMLKSLLKVRSGDFGTTILSLRSFPSILAEYLKRDMINGWLYERQRDGCVYPMLVTDIRYHPRDREEKDKVVIHTIAYGQGTSNRSIGNFSRTFILHGEDVVRRNVHEILLTKNLEKETPELFELHQQDLAYFNMHVSQKFAEQFVVTGSPVQPGGPYRTKKAELGHKVILDTESGDYSAVSKGRNVYWLSAGNMKKNSILRDIELTDGPVTIGAGLSDAGDEHGEAILPIPEHPVVYVFDLKLHEYFWYHATHLRPHQYNHSLRDKLILPKSHRDLLDILTTDLDAFIDDIIEGKSAGNVILCQGKPGVGKTLTAEIYAELINRPLYSVHSGSLGTTAASIEKNLKEIFKSARRWNAVLLLDEADVFVVQRGQNIEQNAIVAEFLRTLEYFDGLLFMTTNRANDIDEAIISRCAAIIQYKVPVGEDVAKIWQVLAQQFNTELPSALMTKLLATFPSITPRDIKMLLRLALRVAKFHNEELNIDIFRQCALFRSIETADLADTDA